MDSHDLKHLYKYRTVADARRILIGRSIRCSHPTAFNDPLDGQANLRLPAVDGKFRECLVQEYLRLAYVDPPPRLFPGLGELLARIWRSRAQTTSRKLLEEQIREAVSALDKDTRALERLAGDRLRQMPQGPRVLCLSATPTSIPMWSHYASQFKGVVVAFDCQADPESMFSVAQPIQYVSTVPQVCSPEEWVRVHTGQQSQPASVLKQLLFTKSDQWAYEQEWRVLGGKGAAGTHQDLPLVADELGGLVIGPMTNKSSAAQLIKLAKSWRPTCAIWATKIDYSAYELVLEQIE